MVNEGWVDILLQSDVVSIETSRAAPVGCTVHQIVLVEHIGESCHAYGQEETRIGIVGCHVIVLLVETVNQWQTAIVGTEGVDQILRWLVEVATTIRHIGDVGTNQAIRPVEVAVCRTVVA